MDSCCNKKSEEISFLNEKYKNILILVFLLNFSMFLVEIIYGLISHSTSLTADSLDMLGDSIVYAMSLFVLNKSLKWNASISLIKGMIMGFFGFIVIIEAILKFNQPILPIASTMMIISSIAFVANLTCSFLLLRHRNDNINMRSTWICSRNDVIANVGVFVAAFLVSMTNSKIPDLIVGMLISFLVLFSSLGIIRESIEKLKQITTNKINR